ncbi:MAG: FHA domain-containing protein [Methylococcaceae bacterium]|nr:FHA domain-containing protein [Methylococcaceae bacterium]
MGLVVKLICIKGVLQGREFPINNKVLHIGADAGNDLIIPNDNYVSRNHAVIQTNGDKLQLIDLKSRNGTLINNTPLVNPIRANLSPQPPVYP